MGQDRLGENRLGQDRFEDVCLTIGELSRRTAVNIETIRYYERIRLLAPPPRTAAGRRTFGLESCRTLAFIKRCRELGFGLNDIRALLALRDTKGPCMDVHAVAARHLEAVQAKLRDLASLERVLAQAVAACPNDESPSCPVLDSLDGVCRRTEPAPRGCC